MLVSSIGYFDVKKNVSLDNNTKSQVQKNTSTEGFGQFDKKHSASVESNSFINSLVNTFRSLFLGEKTENSSKYLSLIA